MKPEPSFLLRPVYAVFRHKIGRPIGDQDLLRAWGHVPSRDISTRGRHGSPAETARINGLRKRVLALRAAHGGQ